MRIRGLLTGLLLVASCLIAGCGQKGDLIRPGVEEPSVVSETTSVDEREAETNDAQDGAQDNE